MAMADVTVIGREAFVRGSIRGEGDLEIHGRVEGEIEVDGAVTIAPGALVKADVSGRQITVRGAVAGNLSAEQAVRLEEGARVVGDLRAPSIGVADGALVRGNVETDVTGASAKRAERQPAAARPAPAVAKVDKPAVAKEAPRPAATRLVSVPTPAPAPVEKKPVVEQRVAPPVPPPPIVPALRKGAKGAMKKKAR